MSEINFLEHGWADYIFLQENDRKLLKKVNNLLKDIERNGNTGIGKPEALKGNLSGWYSREIDKKNRLIYKIADGRIYILQCRNHYDDK